MNVLSNELVSHECGLLWAPLLWTWSVMNVFCYERGLLITWSVMSGTVINWCVMNGFVMNVVCCELGLMWTWSYVNVICNENGLQEGGRSWTDMQRTGLLWKLSASGWLLSSHQWMWFVMTVSVMNVVCYERCQLWTWFLMNVLCNEWVCHECGV